MTSLTLNRLGQRQCADLIGEVVGGRPFPETLIRAIIERADGIPLFVEELTKSVIESGLVHETDSGLVVDGPLPPLAIPTTLQGSLLARLDRLSTTREVAQIGAAIGREFNHHLVAVVAGLPEAQLQAALSQLEAAGLIFRRGGPPEAAYIFKHALVQDAAHDSLLKSRRQQLHALIAEAIEQHYPETASNQPQLLAQHYAEAGFAERSARAWLAAGHLSASRSASGEAALQFARGIDVLQVIEPGAAMGSNSTCASAVARLAPWLTATPPSRPKWPGSAPLNSCGTTRRTRGSSGHAAASPRCMGRGPTCRLTPLSPRKPWNSLRKALGRRGFV